MSDAANRLRTMGTGTSVLLELGTGMSSLTLTRAVSTERWKQKLDGTGFKRGWKKEVRRVRMKISRVSLSRETEN